MRTTKPFTVAATLVADLPARWERFDHPEADLCLREPLDTAASVGFRANVVVTSGQVTGSLEEWQVEVEDQLDEILDGYLLLDFEPMVLAGGEGTRRLATYLCDGVPVTLEQWSRLDRGHAVCLTFTVATAAYDDLADDLAATVATLRRAPEAAS